MAVEEEEEVCHSQRYAPVETKMGAEAVVAEVSCFAEEVVEVSNL